MEQEKIKNIITELIQQMGISLEDVDVEELEGAILVSLYTKDATLFVGDGARGLRALNIVTRSVLEAQDFKNTQYVTVDVNDFHKKKIEKIRNQAKTLADRAKTLKCDVEMSPMNAYERMIVHKTLKNEEGVNTSSKGEGPLRHVVVSYKNIDPA